jgi:hypothetical protein
MQGVILGSIALLLLLFGLLSGSGRSGRPVDRKGETGRRDFARGIGRMVGTVAVCMYGMQSVLLGADDGEDCVGECSRVNRRMMAFLYLCPGEWWIMFAIFEAEIATRLIAIHTKVRLASSTQTSDLPTTTNTSRCPNAELF